MKFVEFDKKVIQEMAQENEVIAHPDRFSG